MFGRSKDKASPIAGKIDTLIARSATLRGDVEFSGGLHLEGRVIGNVGCAKAAAAGAGDKGGKDAKPKDKGRDHEPCTLWISEPGIVEGSVDVPSVVINGTVIGDVTARERVVIGAQARITGNVNYGAIEMALGAQVSGKLVPVAAASAATAAAAAMPPAISATSSPGSIVPGTPIAAAPASPAGPEAAAVGRY